MPTGAYAYINYGYETVFKTAATANKTFGHSVKVGTLDRKNALKLLYGLGSQDATQYPEGTYEGGLVIDFDLANPWWLKGALGALVSGAGPPYTHTFTPANQPPSMTVECGIDLATDAVQKFLGVVVAEAKIVAEVNATPHVTLTCMYANESKLTTGIGAQVVDAESAYNMGHCSFEVPTATPIADTQRLEMSIKRNAKMLFGLGSRFASQYAMGQREYGLDTINVFDDASTYLEKLYGAAGGPAATSTPFASATFKMSNDGWGAAVSSSRRFTWTFTGTKVDTHSLPLAVEDVMMESVTMRPLALTSAVVVNATSAMP